MRKPLALRVLLAALVSIALSPAALLAAEKPSLLVVISVDQMRADYLDRFQPFFGKDGFNRFLERGAVFTQAHHRHATTFTAPGHASIGSGLDPRDHGIIGNRWFDAELGAPVYCTEDRGTKWVGAPARAPRPPWAPASPVRTDGAFLGDRLKERFPRARVVGLALKDRAAVLMAGRKADAALWFDEKFARFVTSTYYPPRPELLSFDDRLPGFFALHKAWELSGKIPEKALQKITFDPPELYTAKNPPAGMGATFPHPLATPKAVASSPYGDLLVLDLARFVIERMDLGSSVETPDLLFIGLSSTDYIGHAFGPDSKEIADDMARLDGTLESFFRWLDGRLGPDRTLLFLTADHGVTPIPEVARAKHRLATGRDDPSVAGRVDLESRAGQAARVGEGSPVRVALERHLAKKFGYRLRLDAPNAREGAILFFEEPGLYLNKAAVRRRGVAIERVKEETRNFVAKLPSVAEAFTNTEIGDGLPPEVPHALAIERSFRADRSGDVLVFLKAGWMWSYGKQAGTTHGQPTEDDTHVPLLAWGPGVAAGRYGDAVSPLAIAKTVGALFGFDVGEPDVKPLAAVCGHGGAAREAAARR